MHSSSCCQLFSSSHAIQNTCDSQHKQQKEDQVKSAEDEKKWKGAARPNELLEKGINKKVTEA